MNDVVPFTFENNDVRTVSENGTIWFVAADVCRALGYRDAFNGVRNLDEDEWGTHNMKYRRR